MLLAIVISRLFPEFMMRNIYAKTFFNPIYLYPLPSAWLVFVLTMRKSGMSTMRLLGNIFPKL
ncbi:hypothetical protein [Nostoc sp. PCC 9305]|uniref:hypothetical protein n=1 Tax=Nostoc sp. PCC 9305 TaxID=296636 RepID=UPI0039C5FE73